jgi:hypothetical protein
MITPGEHPCPTGGGSSRKITHPGMLYGVNFPLKAVDAIDDILDYGASKGYKPGSWRNECFFYHLWKAIGHLRKFALGSTEEDHLECALCRLAMAVDIRRTKREKQHGH